MKNIKDITISIFAVIGFVAIITGFTTNESNQAQQTTPESHVWEMSELASSSNGNTRMYTLNKVTGEVRFFLRNEQKQIEKE
tara:strand:+ start:768 stop:1013 length:246 start_codon:yes stop_codon:yes gene_type:complete